MAPTTGERCFLARPYLNTESCPLVIAAFAQAVADSLNLPLLDNSWAPTAPRLTVPTHVRLVFLPPDGPELNPIARVWRDLKDDLAWQQFLRVEAQQDAGGQLLQAYDAPTRPSLTGYPSLVEAIHALSS